MKSKIETITIEGVEYVPKDSLKMAEFKEGLPYVLVRTYSAGVHLGYLKSHEKKEVVLLQSIRIWYWSGAASISQIAVEGVKNPDKCKFSIPVPEITLTEAIEIIPITAEAERNIKAVPTWKV